MMNLVFIISVVLVVVLTFFLYKFFMNITNKNKNNWLNLINQNDNLGFKKRIIPLEFLPQTFHENIFFHGKLDEWTNGIWLNYQSKLIKFRDGREISFQDLYDVRIDSIGVSKTKGLGVGDTLTLFGASTTEHLKSISVQIVIKDPKGGVKTNELMLCNNFFSIKKGTPQANAYEKCSSAILNEISYIIDNYS